MNTWGTETCLLCYEKLATVRFPACNHCVYCEQCSHDVTESAERNGRQPVCPLDRIPFVRATLQRQLVPVEPTRLSNVFAEGDYPHGFRVFGDQPNEIRLLAAEDILNAVRDALAVVDLGVITPDDFREMMQERLTIRQLQIVYAELIRDHDLHHVLVSTLNAFGVHNESMFNSAAIMVHVMDSNDHTALLGRAAISMIGDIIEHVGSGGLSQSFPGFSSGEPLSNLLLGLMFCFIDCYRCAKGSITPTELAIRVVEHTAGCTAAYTCGPAGLAVGTLCGGPLLGLLGMMIVGFGADYLARAVVRSTTNNALTFFADSARVDADELEIRAAEALGVNLNGDSRNVAQGKFRKELFLNHPDKFINSSAKTLEEKKLKTTELIASWQIVRGHYERHPEKCDGDFSESFIEVMVLKVRDTVNGAWRVARSYFSNVTHDVTNDELEKVERVTLHL